MWPEFIVRCSVLNTDKSTKETCWRKQKTTTGKVWKHLKTEIQIAICSFGQNRSLWRGSEYFCTPHYSDFHLQNIFESQCILLWNPREKKDKFEDVAGQNSNINTFVRKHNPFTLSQNLRRSLHPTPPSWQHGPVCFSAILLLQLILDEGKTLWQHLQVILRCVCVCVWMCRQTE